MYWPLPSNLHFIFRNSNRLKFWEFHNFGLSRCEKVLKRQFFNQNSKIWTANFILKLKSRSKCTCGWNNGDVYRLGARAESSKFDQPQPIHCQVNHFSGSGGFFKHLQRHPRAVARHEDYAHEGVQSVAERVIERSDSSDQRGRCSRWSGWWTVNRPSYCHQVDILFCFSISFIISYLTFSSIIRLLFCRPQIRANQSFLPSISRPEITGSVYRTSLVFHPISSKQKPIDSSFNSLLTNTQFTPSQSDWKVSRK